MKEIEYKFLLKELPKEFCKDENKHKIIQYYYTKNDVCDYINLLKIDKNSTKNIKFVRLRVEFFDKTTKFFLTAKSDGEKIRDEFETQITQKQAAKILTKQPVGKVVKNRYKIKKENYTFEFDEYFEQNKGLVTCEIEIKDNVDDYLKITKILKEYFKAIFVDVTNNKKYKNINLSKENFYENNK